MKKCPNCNRIFPTDESFCVECGTPLITHFDGEHSFSGFSVSLEQPTQIVSRPTHGQTIPPQFYPTPPPSNLSAVVKNDSKWLYVIIGALLAVVLGMIGFFLISRGADEKALNENANWTQVNSPDENKTPVNQNSSVAKTQLMAIRTPKPNNGVNNSIVNDMPIVPKSDPPPRSFNRNYYGTVGGDGSEMRLTRNGSSLGGKVVPQDRYADISVSGSIDDEGNFEMNEYSDINVITGVYRGRISGTTINGTWSKPDGSRARRLFLRSN